MTLGFAILGSFVALIPGASFLLIPMELFMLYLIASKYGAFDLAPFLAMGAALVTISGFLKGLATFLHAMPIVGQAANSLVACAFILVVGTLADNFYRSRTA